MKTRRTRILFGAVAVTSAARLVTLVAMVVINGLITHQLSKSAAGIYFQLWSAVNFAVVLGQCGFRTAVVSWIARALQADLASEARGAVTTTVYFTLTSYLTCSLLLMSIVAIIKLFEPGLQLSWQGVGLCGLWLLNLGIQFTLPEIFRGFSHFVVAAITAGLLSNLLTSTILAVFFVYGVETSLDGVLMIIALGGLLNSAMVLILVWGTVRRLPYGQPMPIYTAVRYAAPIVVADISRSAMEILDTVIVGATMGSTQAAIYGLGSRFSALATVPNQILVSLMSPDIVKLHAAGEKSKLELVLRRLSLLAASAGLLITAGFYQYGAQIIEFVNGPGYSSAIPVLLVSSLGYSLALVISSGSTALVLTGFQRLVMNATLFAACVCLLAQLTASLAFANLMTVMAIKSCLGICLAIVCHRLCRLRLGVASHWGLPMH